MHVRVTRARSRTHRDRRGTEDCQSIRASRPGIRQLGVVTFPEQSPHHPRPRSASAPPHTAPHPLPIPIPTRRSLGRALQIQPTPSASGRGTRRDAEGRPGLARRAPIGRGGRAGHAHRAGDRVRDAERLERPALAEDRTRYRFHGSRGGGAPRRQAPRRRPPPRGERTPRQAWPKPSW